ncbi:hypothetical protein Moror_11700 [Moniliophthora roreri MCA 2997]|uniref:F-box domain-containing protein n=1 Tax=Moniliophthora roreri (strain MCA 2997) TaxID=1381753 RepID=V2X3K1_MONRO|nr:hypothetical protein Moror_11700 [Moniliophthora roreri MCA 2997]
MAVLDKLPTELLLEIISLVSAEEKRTHVTTIKALRLVNRRFYSLTTPFLPFTSIIIKTEHDAPIEEHSNLSSSFLNVSTLSSFGSYSEAKNPTTRQEPPTQAALEYDASDVSACLPKVYQGRKIQNIWKKQLGKAASFLTSLRSISVSSPASLAILWKTLRQEHIPIKRLLIRQRIEPALVDYLASYSGLERLEIPLCAHWDTPWLAWSFCKRVLPKHAGSLTDLYISEPYAFGKHNMPYYEQCVALERWGFGMNLFWWDLEKDWLTPCFKICQKLPRLSKLLICPRLYPLGLVRKENNLHAKRIVCEGVGRVRPSALADSLHIDVGTEDHVDFSSGFDLTDEPIWIYKGNMTFNPSIRR